jgi:hypothetical protein
MIKRTESEEKKFFAQTVADVFEFCNGDPRAALTMLMSMSLGVIISGFENDFIASADYFERVCASTVEELRKEADNRDFTPRPVLH